MIKITQRYTVGSLTGGGWGDPDWINSSDGYDGVGDGYGSGTYGR